MRIPPGLPATETRGKRNAKTLQKMTPDDSGLFTYFNYIATRDMKGKTKIKINKTITVVNYSGYDF